MLVMRRNLMRESSGPRKPAAAPQPIAASATVATVASSHVDPIDSVALEDSLILGKRGPR